MIAARSPVVHLAIRAATPLALVVGVYLLFAGHNNPGGGFAAGLVFGAVLTLRTITNLAPPIKPTPLISAGILIVLIVSAAPIVWGGPFLDQQVVEVELPLLDKVKSGSALPFDIGVTAIVIGLIAALVEGLSGSSPVSSTEGELV